jgi:hypothetical protein
VINVEEALNQLADNGHEVDFFAVQGEDERIYYRIDGILRSEDEVLQSVMENETS